MTFEHEYGGGETQNAKPESQQPFPEAEEGSHTKPVSAQSVAVTLSQIKKRRTGHCECGVAAVFSELVGQSVCWAHNGLRSLISLAGWDKRNFYVIAALLPSPWQRGCSPHFRGREADAGCWQYV